jgi:Tol biopolymer transport system component
VHDLETGEDRVLDNDPDPKEPQTKAEALDSAISRDGKLVAYSWWIKDDTYEVRIANTGGKPNPRRLYNAGPGIGWLAPYDWSPDGKWIAVELESEKHAGQIVVVSVPDGSVRTVKTLANTPTIQRMRFSPDGKYLGYDWAVNGRQHVIVQPLDGGPEIVAADFPGDNQMMGWAPDGRLLFANDRTGEMTLWALPFSNGKVAGTPTFLTVIGKTSPVGVSQSGKLFYLTHNAVAEGPHIVTAPLDPISGKLLSPPEEVTKGALGNSIVPCYSPDGKYLAYLSGSLAANPENRVIKIQSVAGGETARVLPLSLRGQFAPSWTADSSALLFSGEDPSDQFGLFRIDAQTGATTPVALLEKPGSSASALSPDGKTFYFPSTGKEKAFIARDLATGAEKELIRRPDILGIRLSPDGRYIVTPSYDAPSNSRTLLLIPTAGGEPRELMRVPAGVEDEPSSRYMKGNSLIGASWAGDSRSFYTRKRSADRKKQDEVWQVFLDGQQPRQLEPTIANNVVAGGWSISPDGRHIAYTVIPPPQHRDPSVLVLENFLPPVAKR